MKASSFLLMMMAVNVFLGMVTLTMNDMSGTEYFDFGSTVAGNMSSTGQVNGSFLPTYEDTELNLADSIDIGGGTAFSDSTRSLKGWFTDVNDEYGLIGSVVRQPAGFMFKMGLPDMIVFSFAVIWYVIAVISLIALIVGRDQ